MGIMSSDEQYDLYDVHTQCDRQIQELEDELRDAYRTISDLEQEVSDLYYRE